MYHSAYPVMLISASNFTLTSNLALLFDQSASRLGLKGKYKNDEKVIIDKIHNQKLTNNKTLNQKMFVEGIHIYVKKTEKCELRMHFLLFASCCLPCGEKFDVEFANVSFDF